MEYATTAEVRELMELDPEDPNPPGIKTAIRKASSLVSAAISGAIYPVDDQEYPSDVKQREAVRQAAAMTASEWLSNGVDPRKGPDQVPRRVASKSLEGASISYTSSTADDYRAKLAACDKLTTEAYEELRSAGLISNVVSTVGTFGGRNYDLTPNGSLVLGEATLGT